MRYFVRISGERRVGVFSNLHSSLWSYGRNSSPILVTSTYQKNVRYLSAKRQPKPKGLFGKFIDNIREGFEKDKEMQENLKRFQEEAKSLRNHLHLEQPNKIWSFGDVKEQTSQGISKISSFLKDGGDQLSESASKVVKEVKSSETFRKGQEISEELGRSAQEAYKQVKEQGEEIRKTETAKTVTKGLKTVKEDLFDPIAEVSKPYERPQTLRRRTNPNEQYSMNFQEKKIEANDEATGVVLHKDSVWYQQWKNFKENNPVVNGIFDLKMKYDESDNIFIRASRTITDKVGDIFQDVFSQSDMAKTLAEITKIDPNFNKDKFLHECQYEIIPTVLQAYINGDMDLLQDWCHERTYSILAAQIEQNKAAGIKVDTKILDIREVDLALAKIMEQGPVLILTFSAQQTMCAIDARGNVIEGGENNIELVHYVWAMCRDQTILKHEQAWKVLEFAVQQTSQYY
ncbi:LOW QUALITY PROTEIN: mitochondrial import inner membrane translocase subunit TIM44-like [Xenia sp. Carnegie-2017]|uniref:LOW QUALITY PROTEIN: mitochondrial import inner membrane translocase subunit TIM44-like n=1 Tax=Xenia sp. Carnegie-2017 TaxID=2897299 RepID=UPI001F03D69C|nr:LOW QUALITY PROTEIN: mitochondrial import inner membrane translocase subunit TIM44-like [Xenia sp. Carnegie-2017]